MTPIETKAAHQVVSTFLTVFDLAGTFVFALSGATAAVKNRLDVFGILVLGFAAGNAGGIARDVMIGAIPPSAIDEWRYVVVSVVAGLIVFFAYPLIDRMSSPVQVFDAAGLGLFCVAGAGKALAFHETLKSFEGDRCGNTSWHGHRDRRWHGAGRAAAGSSKRAADGAVCGCGAAGRSILRGRPKDGNAVARGCAGWCCAVHFAALACDPIPLASSRGALREVMPATSAILVKRLTRCFLGC